MAKQIVMLKTAKYAEQVYKNPVNSQQERDAGIIMDLWNEGEKKAVELGNDEFIDYAVTES